MERGKKNKNTSQVLAPFLNEWREGWVVAELVECGENEEKLYVLQQDGLIHTFQLSENGKVTKSVTYGKSDTSHIAILMSMISGHLYVLACKKRCDGVKLLEFNLLQDGTIEYYTSITLNEHLVLFEDFSSVFKRCCFADKRVVFVNEDYHLSVYDMQSRRRISCTEKKLIC